MPTKSNNTTGTTPQSWLLFAAGIVGLAVIFYFGYDGDLSIRVALALAAAAIAAFIPGFLEVKSHLIRGGGAIAVMVVVLFADDIGRQFSPKSQAPGVPSVVRLSKDQVQYLSEVAAAQFDISQGQNSVAIETLKHARKLNADPKLALHMLGTLYFSEGNYSRAAEAFEQGFRPGDSDGGRLAYNAAMAHDAIGDTAEAIKWIELAHKNMQRDGHMELWREVNFDRGLIHMIAWINRDAPKPTPDFEMAVSSFQQFLDAQSKSTHWAEYDIACLHATVAAHHVERKLSAVETYTRAVRHFDKFLSAVKALDPENRDKVIELVHVVLGKIARNEKRAPGEPVACPAIKDAWEGIGRDWNEVLTGLSAEPQHRAARL
jgi:tetratricopeptide (TPR) repeat protein